MKLMDYLRIQHEDVCVHVYSHERNLLFTGTVSEAKSLNFVDKDVDLVSGRADTTGIRFYLAFEKQQA